MSRFFKVKCKCGGEQMIFSCTSTKISCNSCSEILAEPTGGEAVFSGKIAKELG